MVGSGRSYLRKVADDVVITRAHLVPWHLGDRVLRELHGVLRVVENHVIVLAKVASAGIRVFACDVSPRMIEYVTQNFTEDRVDLNMGMAMHRGLGPHSRGYTDSIRGLGSIASPVHSLGDLSLDKHDLRSAEHYYQEALALGYLANHVRAGAEGERMRASLLFDRLGAYPTLEWLFPSK